MKFKSEVQLEALNNATLDTNQFLVSDGGVVKYRTGSEVLSDLGIDPLVKAGVAINKGQAVYVTTADGTNIIVGKASNLTEAASSKTLGLLNATVPLNGMANVITNGLLEGLNTSTAIIGDPVWLGEDGNLLYGLTSKPYAPKHLVYIGIVTRVNLNNGEIFINVQNGFELSEIHDVDIKTTTPVNKDILGYNGSLWVNKDIAEWLGYIPADDANVVHKTGAETILGQKTFNGTLNTSTTIFDLAAVDNSPSGASVPDSVVSRVHGHNGTSGSLVSCFYGLMENNKNVGVAIENLTTMADATNSVGVRVGFKSTSTTNNIFIGRRGDTNVFRVDDYGNTYSTKLIAGTTVDNGIDALQVSGSTRSITTLTDGITAKILTYPTDPYGLVFRSDSFGNHSIQNQREDDNLDLYPLLLQPLGSNVNIGTLDTGQPAYGLNYQLAVASSTGGVIDIRSTNTAIVANSLLGRVQFTGKDDATTGYTSAAIEAISAGTTQSGNNGGGILRFMTSVQGYSSDPVERMRINSGGTVSINTTATDAMFNVLRSASGPASASQLAAIYANNPSTDTIYANSVGLYAKTNTTGGKAVYGEAFSGGYGGFFVGRGYFSGDLGVGVSVASEKLHINGNLRLTGFFKDSSNLAGTSGQVLSSNGVGTSWVGVGGVHSLVKLSSGQSTTSAINSANTSSGTTQSANTLIFNPYIPAQNLTSTSLSIFIGVSNVASMRMLIYSDLDGKPYNKIYESASLDCSTVGLKTVTTSQTFESGKTYWLATYANGTFTPFSLQTTQCIAISSNNSSTTINNSYSLAVTFGSAPTTISTITIRSGTIPAININI